VQQNEHGLRHIIRHVCIAQPPAGQAVNPPQMPPNQIGKRRIRAGAVLIEELHVGHRLYNRRGRQMRTAPRAAKIVRSL
jgi:hypothetical protein